MVRIATFNVNGVNGRLPVLLKWFTATNYDIVCLQELKKTSDEKFPAEAIREAGYGAIWHGQITAMRGSRLIASRTKSTSPQNDRGVDVVVRNLPMVRASASRSTRRGDGPVVRARGDRDTHCRAREISTGLTTAC